MAQRQPSWHEPTPRGRPRLDAINEQRLSNMSPSNFRADARTFHPFPSPDPYYALQTTTFMPPDTPQLGSFPSTPPRGSGDAQQPTPMLPRSHRRTPSNESPAKPNPLYDLRPIWSTVPNEMVNEKNFAYNRDLERGRETPGGVSLLQDHTPVQSSTPSVSPEKAASAKNLAAFIKSGGLSPDERARPSNLSPTRRGRGGHMGMPRHHRARQQQQHQQPAMPPANATPDPLVQEWKKNGGPTWEEMVQNVAFVERTRAGHAAIYGVIKLSDIPYTTTKPEVVALLGERAPMVQMPPASGTYAIHIIMERSTAKSMDCYVEFETFQAAQAAVARLEHHGRPMLQARRITVRLSSQEELMKDIFPRAKCVTWLGGNPMIEENKDPFSAGFQGFISNEELVMMVKFAQNPHRSRFASKHQQRTFESVMSVLFKYPWFAITLYTLNERDQIFKAVRDQLLTLAEKLHRDGSQYPLDYALLEELLDAGLKCPGFSERQRAELIDSVDGSAYSTSYVTPIAPHWPFEVLQRKDELSEEHVLFFTSLLRKSAAPSTTGVSLAQISAMTGHNAQHPQNPIFGNFKIQFPEKKGLMTMADAAQFEWDHVEDALKRVCKG